MFHTIVNAIHRVTVLLNAVGIYLLLAIMMLTVSDIVSRTLFSKPIMGAYEITEILLAMFILLGIAYTQHVDGHVKVILFEKRLPRRVTLSLDILVAILSLILFAIITWKGSVHAINAFHRGLATDILRIPAYPFLFFVPLGAGFLSLELLVKIISLARGLIRR